MRGRLSPREDINMTERHALVLLALFLYGQAVGYRTVWPAGTGQTAGLTLAALAEAEKEGTLVSRALRLHTAEQA